MLKLTRREMLAAFALTSVRGVASGAEQPGRSKVDPLSTSSLRAMISKLHATFKPFKATSWSRNHPEERPQSLDAYIGSKPNRTTAERDKLYIQPLGELPKTYQPAMDASAELLAKVFGVQVKTLQPISLDTIPAAARRNRPDWGMDQILTTYVLQSMLKPRRPDDAVAVLGLTAMDLWPGKDWNFVFGQASLSERVGVWSLYRFGDPSKGEDEATKFRLRALKLATHETGHMFGIRHCVHYQCGMNGSNSLDETDDGPLEFCPQCVAKICWASRINPADWFAGLVDFAKKHDLAEQKIWQDCLKLLS